MKVIFLQQVQNVAQKGDVKNVAEGYARNYLLPHKLAAIATPASLAQSEVKRKKTEEEHARAQETHRTLAKKLAGIAILIQAKADEGGTLFGSVGAQGIVEALRKKGHEVSESAIRLEQDIKKVGEHEVRMDFGDGAKAIIQVEVSAEK